MLRHTQKKSQRKLKTSELMKIFHIHPHTPKNAYNFYKIINHPNTSVGAYARLHSNCTDGVASSLRKICPSLGYPSLAGKTDVKARCKYFAKIFINQNTTTGTKEDMLRPTQTPPPTPFQRKSWVKLRLPVWRRRNAGCYGDGLHS